MEHSTGTRAIKWQGVCGRVCVLYVAETNCEGGRRYRFKQRVYFNAWTSRRREK